MLRRASAALLPRLLQQQGGAGAAPLAAAATHVPAFSWGDDKPSASGAQVFRREWVGPWPRCGAANLSTRLSTAQCPGQTSRGSRQAAMPAGSHQTFARAPLLYRLQRKPPPQSWQQRPQRA